VNLRRIIERHLRSRTRGVNAAGDLHAVIAANAGESGAKTHVSSRSRHRVVQRGGRTVVDEHEHETDVGETTPPTSTDHA
jgi:hypothetical protein